VLDAFSRERVVPEITLVDRCATPLKLCRWYAERFGYAIETVPCDLTEFRPERPYDLICVHSLLSCIPSERHQALVATWHGLLRPGGLLMMANNLYLESTDRTSRFSPDQIAAYRKRVVEAAMRGPHPGLPSSDELEAMAAAYASKVGGTVINSRRYLTELLEAQGFELQVARFGDLVADGGHQRSGAPVAGRKEYAWIIARRT